jgi:MFS transporter, DHA2 family, multidrug resistance protein
VVWRILQGFLGGAMVPTVFATGFMMFSGKKATVVPAVLGLVATLAPALGPSIGGVITEFLSWRWLFFINIVPGLVIALMIPRLVKLDTPDFTLARKFDWLGAISLALFLGCLQYVLDEGPRKGWFDNHLMTELLIVSGLAGVAFVTRSLSYREPLVDLRAFRHRDFSIGCALSFIFGFGLYSGVFLMPIYLSKVQGMNSMQIGTTVFIVGVANFLATPLTVFLLGRIRIKVMLGMGFGFFGISFLLLAQINSSWSENEIFLAQVMRGIATMFCIIPATGLALNSLSKRDLAGASGIFNLMRNLGGAIGIAVVSSQLFYDRFNLHYDALASRLNITNLNVVRQMNLISNRFDSFLVDSDRVNTISLKYLSQIALREAFTMSLADVYYIRCLSVSYVIDTINQNNRVSCKK